MQHITDKSNRIKAFTIEVLNKDIKRILILSKIDGISFDKKYTDLLEDSAVFVVQEIQQKQQGIIITNKYLKHFCI